MDRKSGRGSFAVSVACGAVLTFVAVGPVDSFARPGAGGSSSIPGRLAGDSQGVSVVGKWASGACWGVAAAGSTAYVVDGSRFEVIDFSVPATPVRRGRLSFANLGGKVAVSGAYVFLADPNYGLRVINVTNPDAPFQAGELTGIWNLDRMALAGNTLYATSPSGLLVIDVSSPSSPVQVATWARANVRDVAVSGNVALVVQQGLRVLDTSNPAAPAEIAAVDTTLGVLSVAVHGNYAYVSIAYYGLKVFDISVPSNPVEVGLWYSTRIYGSVVAYGDTVAMGDDIAGGVLINVSVPGSPTLVSGFSSFDRPLQLAFVGNRLYVAARDDGLYLYDLTNIANPVATGRYTPPADMFDVVVAGNYAYVANRVSGMSIVDVSNPAQPTRVSGASFPASYDIAVSGGYACLASGWWGMRVVDVSDPVNPTETGAFVDSVFNDVRGVQVSGSYAYLADGVDGLRIVNISNPAAPAPIGRYDTNQPATHVAVSGGYAYLTGGDGLLIIDVSNPMAPALASTQLSSGVNDVAVSGNIAYVVLQPGTIMIYDVTDPANPTLLGVKNTGSSSVGVAVSGNRAYVADGGGGLVVVDVGNTADPVAIGYYDTSDQAMGVAVAGNLVYVADNRSGLYILDASTATPVALRALSVTALPDRRVIAWDVVDEVDIAEYRVYRRGPGDTAEARVRTVPATGRVHYEVLDAAPLSAGAYRYTLSAMETDGSERVLGSRDVSIQTTPGVALEQNVPNPFNPSTEIRVELASPGSVNLSVYDVAGRFVTTIYAGKQTAGTRRYRWAGRDARGRPVASGVYVYRLRVGSRTFSRKMVLVR